MKLKVKLLESDSKIRQLIVTALKKDLYQNLSKAGLAIEKQARILIRNAIVSQPEYLSLLNGKLNYEFGLTDAEQRLDVILRIWTNNIIVQVKSPTGSQVIKSTVTLNVINSDFSDVLNIPEAFQQTEKGTGLEWLKWLLIDGDKIIVRDYEVVIESDGSRTNVAVMRKKSGSNWGVPSEFAGTLQNNWVTRALGTIDGTITNLISDELKRAWQ